MFDFRHYIDLITEAQHDALVDAIIRQFPDQEKEIRDHAIWASQTLIKADRINWYLGKLRAYLSDQLTPEVLGDYQFTTMEQLQHDLAHFYGYRDAGNNIPAPINSYQYQRQPIGKLISDLQQIEQKWLARQNEERGVDPQTGDYPLFEFPGGIKWWWINRAYCPEEGRSGRHCGNVVGRQKKNQRILSLRNARNQVILTFIREPDGTLGEMKAKSNQKPQEKFHPHIMKLLLWDNITGISGMGYLPDMNFSVFDLNEEQINYLDQHKSKLISDQAGVTPFELLKAPDTIKQKYLKYAEQKQPAVRTLINNNTFEQWLNEIKNNNELIFYLPSEYISKFPNYLNTLIYEAKKGNNVLKIPKIISRNFDYMKEIVSEVPRAIGITNQYADRYEELCKIALTNDGTVLELIDEENRTLKLCKVAITNGAKLASVPEKFRTYEIYKLAVTNDGLILGLVPEKHRIEELCKIAVTNNGWAIKFVPLEYQTAEICKIAVTNDGFALQFIDQKNRTFEVCKIAVTNNGWAIKFVPLEYQTAEICKIAVTNDGSALQFIDQKNRTFEVCKIAITNGANLADVPVKFRTFEVCKIAITNGANLADVPVKFRTFEVCKIALLKNPTLIGQVPLDQIDRAQAEQLIRHAISKRSYLLGYIPLHFRTLEICEFAVDRGIDAIAHVPKEILNINFVKQALSIDFSDFRKEFAIQVLASVINNLPEDLQKTEIYTLFVKKSGMLLQYIPVQYRNLDICKIALRKSKRAIHYVPEPLKKYFRNNI